MIRMTKNKLTSPTIVNVRYSQCDVYIGRGSIWGNPYSHKDGTKAKFKVSSREIAIRKYREYILNGNGRHLIDRLDELNGKILGCYCKPKKCHGDILIELFNSKNDIDSL